MARKSHPVDGHGGGQSSVCKILGSAFQNAALNGQIDGTRELERMQPLVVRIKAGAKSGVLCIPIGQRNAKYIDLSGISFSEKSSKKAGSQGS